MRYKLSQLCTESLSRESFGHATLNKKDGAHLDISMNSFLGW